jgi:hypothetical protein
MVSGSKLDRHAPKTRTKLSQTSTIDYLKTPN